MEKAVKWTLTMILCAVAITQIVQVFTRYVLKTPLVGIDEATLYTSIWLYMLGAAGAAYEKSHITANVLDTFLKTNRSKIILEIIANIVSIVVCSWLFYWVWDFIKYSWRTWRETSALYWPVFYADIPILICMIAVVIFLFRDLFNNAKSLKNSGE